LCDRGLDSTTPYRSELNEREFQSLTHQDFRRSVSPSAKTKRRGGPFTNSQKSQWRNDASEAIRTKRSRANHDQHNPFSPTHSPTIDTIAANSKHPQDIFQRKRLTARNKARPNTAVERNPHPNSEDLNQKNITIGQEIQERSTQSIAAYNPNQTVEVQGECQ